MFRDIFYSRNKDLYEQYQNWQDYNRLNNSKYATNLCLFVMSFMVFFDYLFVQEPTSFIVTRAISVAVLLPNYFLINRLSIVKSASKTVRYLSSLSLLWPPFVYMSAYFYLSFFLTHEKFNVYYIGIHIGTFYTTLFYYRFWVEQYIFNLVIFSLATVLAAISSVEMRDYYLIIAIANLVSLSFGYYFRREFVYNLFSKYNLFKAMVPEKVASFLLVTDGKVDHNQAFEARHRFTVCVCADWRNFQTLCANKTSDEVSNMLEKYYDIILKNLEEIVPGQNYYFNWTADELFVVFFNDEDKRERVIQDALKFSTSLGSDIYDEIQKSMGDEIRYDVGVASGIGLLGLQGPKFLKKTTITGEVAGMAKRFESEAKGIRKEIGHSDGPIIVVDETLFHFAKVLEVFGGGVFTKAFANEKDVKEMPIYYWINKREEDHLMNVKKIA